MSSSALARICLPSEPCAANRVSVAPVEEEDTTTVATSARVGYFGAIVPGGGLAVAWRLPPELELGLSAAYGRADLTGAFGDQALSDPALSGDHVDQLTLTGMLVQAEARYLFPTGNFTATAGLGWRRLVGHAALHDPDGVTCEADARVTNIVATVAAGNLWSWPSGFFVGVDWLGLALPMTNQVSVATTGTSSAAAKLDADAHQLAKTLGGAPALILLVGSAGWRF